MSLIRRKRKRFRKNRPFLRWALKRKLKQGKLSAKEANAVRRALDDDDLLESAYNVTDAEEPVSPDDVDSEDDIPTNPGKRDWAGFFDALASFVERLLKALLELLSGLGTTGLGGL